MLFKRESEEDKKARIEYEINTLRENGIDCKNVDKIIKIMKVILTIIATIIVLFIIYMYVIGLPNIIMFVGK